MVTPCFPPGTGATLAKGAADSLSVRMDSGSPECAPSLNTLPVPITRGAYSERDLVLWATLNGYMDAQH